MTALYRLSLVDAARSIAEGRFTSQDLVRACLDRIAEREPKTGAWVHLDPDHAMAQARHRDAEPRRGPLHGVPVGIKDIIDTADMPTAYGSIIYRGHRPPADAACVALLRRAGAVILGKTLSTEFAFFPPGKTTNPRNPEHTPGGSSSGSAAAVADEMVPLAFGTQTAGSITRPAAFCGVVGYKFSFGEPPMAGIKPFTPSLDTLGCFTRSVSDILLVRSALVAAEPELRSLDRAPRVVLCRTPQIDRAEQATLDALDWAVGRCEAAGAAVTEHKLPPSFDRLVDAQATVMSFEAARVFAYEFDRHVGSLHPAFRQFLDEASKVTLDQYRQALAAAQPCRIHLEELLDSVDVLLTPAVQGEAPRGLAWTGDPVFNRIWTYLGLPTVGLPGYTGPLGLPVGVQLVGQRGGDDRLVSVAAWIEKAFARD